MALTGPLPDPSQVISFLSTSNTTVAKEFIISLSVLLLTFTSYYLIFK